MVFYVPMLLTSLVILGLQIHSQPKQSWHNEMRCLGLSFGALIVASLGYTINTSVLSVNHKFQSANELKWSGLSVSAWLDKCVDFLGFFGYPGDDFLKDDIRVFSLGGILGVFGLLTAGAIVFSLFRLCMRWKNLARSQRVIPFLFIAILLVQGGIFSWTGDPDGKYAYYWLTAIPFVFPALQLEGETENFQLPATRKIGAMAFACCFIATSIGAVHQFFSSGYRINPHLQTVSNWLLENGYTQGYANFWNADVVTEWTNGEVEVWVTNNFNTMKIYEWLQKTSHIDPPEGPIFLLTTEEELDWMGLSQLYWWSNVVYEEDDSQALSKDGHYLIMTYKDYDDMMNAIHGAQSWEQEAAQETQDTQSA